MNISTPPPPPHCLSRSASQHAAEIWEYCCSAIGVCLLAACWRLARYVCSVVAAVQSRDQAQFLPGSADYLLHRLWDRTCMCASSYIIVRDRSIAAVIFTFLVGFLDYLYDYYFTVPDLVCVNSQLYKCIFWCLRVYCRWAAAFTIFCIYANALVCVIIVWVCLFPGRAANLFTRSLGIDALTCPTRVPYSCCYHSLITRVVRRCRSLTSPINWAND